VRRAARHGGVVGAHDHDNRHRASYDRFEFNTFDVELFYAENRVAIKEAAALGYDDVELTLSEFLAAQPDVPPGPRMYGRPRRVIVPPPPSG
jgi:hypothetical protein